MKNQNRRVYQLLLVFFTLGAAYWAFNSWIKRGQDVWRLIPNEAIMVVESTHSGDVLLGKSSSKTQSLHQIPFLFDATQQLNILKKFCSAKAFQEFITEKTISYSLHRENKKNLRFVFYVPYSPLQDKTFLDEIAHLKSKAYKVIPYQFEGRTINEIYNTNQELIFSYLTEGNYLIGCTSTILLEDVVRTAKNPVGSFFKDNPFQRTRYGLAHIYFRSDALREVRNLLPTQVSANLIHLFGQVIPKNPDFVFNTQKNKNYLYASVLTESQSRIPLLNIFDGQTAPKIHCTDLIPQNTATLIRLGFDKTVLLEKRLTEYLEQEEELAIEDRDSLNRLFEFRLQDIYPLLGDEVAFCELETNQDEPANKLIFLHTKDANKALNLLDKFADNAERGIYPKPIPEQYRGYHIRRLNIEQFPSLLFGNLFQGFYQGFFTVRGSYVIYANDLAGLKTYIDHLTEGFVWRNSPLHQNFVTSLRAESQVLGVAIPTNLWSNLYFSLPPRWQSSLSNHEERIKNMQFIGLENIIKNNLVSTQLVIDRGGKTIKSSLLNRFFQQQSYQHDAPIQSVFNLEKLKPTADKILVQDATNRIFTLGQDIQTAGNTSLKSSENQLQAMPLVSGMKQMLFNYSGNNLHFMERADTDSLRSWVVPTPAKLGISAVGSSSNAIYFSDNLGQLHKYEIERKRFGKIPIRTKFKRVVGIKALKIKGQPFVAVLEDEGILYLLNDKGHAHYPFPVSIGTKVESNFICEEENSQMIITLISKQGELIKIDESGNKILQKQLTRSDKSAVFQVYEDTYHRNWLIGSKSLNEIRFFDKKGDEVMTIQGNNTLQTQIDFFTLNAQANVIRLFDGVSNTLYNAVSKEMLGGNYLRGTAPAVLTYSEAYNKMFVFNPNGKNVEIWTVKMK